MLLFFSGSAPDITCPCFPHYSCRKTGRSVPQVVFGKPKWGNVAKQTHCAVHMSEDATELGQTTRLVLRAVQDNKYDGRQFRQLSLSLTVAKRTENNMEIITKTAFRIPVSDLCVCVCVCMYVCAQLAYQKLSMTQPFLSLSH